MDTTLKVLIVDDYDMTRDLLKVILRSDRFDIVGEARSCAECLKLAPLLQPDIILLDIVMPDGVGLSLLPELKRRLPASKILMVTSSDSDVAIKKAMQGGADGYVVKPFNTESVLGTMRKIRTTFAVASSASFKRA
ncbi:response regulator [Noviherbaspirillum galbum]|uniref:Response regulator transcription factor n=1 Tax=Noviherbaspirillum galbum TaxID=2709383 RepID=A0A6B3SNG2_9BURK|nr:response regulator [Noviherbaspirillum galbum]NEX60795.1 response regulator transcription factor [Noviherbaspirillum galbum]